jgi:hypothetical protein
MAIPATQINYPLTTFNIADATNTAVLDGTHLRIENNAVASVFADLTIATLQVQNNTDIAILSASGGVDLSDGTTGFHTELKQDVLKSQFASFDMSFNALTLGGVASTEGQVITADAAGKPYWSDVPPSDVPSLAEVLAVSPAGVATTGQTISNLESLGLFNAAANDSVVLSGFYQVGLTSIALNVNTTADVSGDTKAFSRAYLPIAVSGVLYYLPLYSVPV